MIESNSQNSATLSLIFSILGGIPTALGGVWWFVTWYSRHLKEQIELQKGQIAELKEQIVLLKDDCDDLRTGEETKQERFRALEEERSRLNREIKLLSKERQDLRDKKTQLEGQLHTESKAKVSLEQAAKASKLAAESQKQSIAALQKQSSELDKARLAAIGSHAKDKKAWLTHYRKLTAAISKLQESGDHLELIQKRVNGLAEHEGRIWTREVLADVPAFRPRKMPIISVLNFKGGVGKTTITANLAGMFAKLGKRVLVIDLDYQRSLSQLLLDSNERDLRHSQKRSLQHFLNHSTHDFRTFLEMVGKPLTSSPNLYILPNSDAMSQLSIFPTSQMDDSLEEAEARLMMNWFFDEKPVDIRFLLRKALHASGLESHFDFVLLDCPPRLTTASVNALAASDSVLIPVELDQLSASSVRNIHRGLKPFIANIFPELKILGIVANQVNYNAAGVLGKDKREVWDNLKSFAQGESKVYLFESMIQSNVEFGKKANVSIGEGTIRLAIENSDVRADYDALAKEVLAQIEKLQIERAEAVSA